MPKKNILDKIVKILSRANPKSNNFEAEAAVAAEKAKALMTKHKITQAALDKHLNNAGNYVERIAYVGELSLWLHGLINIIEKITLTRALLQHRKEVPEIKRVVFVGAEDSVNVALELFNHFRRLIDEKAKQQIEFQKRRSAYFSEVDILTMLRTAGDHFATRPGVDSGLIYDSFARGFVTSLLTRIQEDEGVKEDPELKEKAALIVIETDQAIKEYIDNKYGSPTGKTIMPTMPPPTDQQAYLSGAAHGSRESLTPAKKIEGGNI